tara:strand:+ start:160 stop:573 length:414 start_codon:yes stop_codon:yes gene_type:complete
MNSIQSVCAFESPIPLPKKEGSKNFDLEISVLNKKGLILFKSKSFKEAHELFKKAISLAKQFRDPGTGIVSFNLGLTLHQLDLHEDAVEAFATAKKYARGNKKILNSELVLNHKCGFNPSNQCENKMPAKMKVEGSN